MPNSAGKVDCIDRTVPPLPAITRGWALLLLLLLLMLLLVETVGGRAGETDAATSSGNFGENGGNTVNPDAVLVMPITLPSSLQSPDADVLRWDAEEKCWALAPSSPSLSPPSRLSLEDT